MTIKTKKYYDLSTLKLWRKYQERFKTIFIDLDGILFKHKEKRFTKKWFYDEYPINININKLKEILQDYEVKIYEWKRRTSI